MSLVLSRKKDESILLKIPGQEKPIRITVRKIDNNGRVRLSIDAEKSVKILRSELEPVIETTPLTSRV